MGGIIMLRTPMSACPLSPTCSTMKRRLPHMPWVNSNGKMWIIQIGSNGQFWAIISSMCHMRSTWGWSTDASTTSSSTSHMSGEHPGKKLGFFLSVIFSWGSDHQDSQQCSLGYRSLLSHFHVFKWIFSVDRIPHRLVFNHNLCPAATIVCLVSHHYTCEAKGR